MLTKVEARTTQGNVLSFNLYEPSDGMILADVGGLDPVKANIVSSKLAGVDGSRYRSSAREERDVVLKFELVADYLNNLVPDIRRRLYRYFMPKSQVILWFYDSSGTVTTVMGRVETCEAPLFTQEPAMDVAIRCFDPDFVDTVPTIVEGNTSFANIEHQIEYLGTTPTGFEITLFVNRDLGAWNLINRGPDQHTRGFDFAAPLLAGDVLYVNTNRGEKKVQLTRAGVSSSYLSGVSPWSVWLFLDHGTNNYRFYAEGEPIPYTIKYANRYGGL